MQCKKLQKSVFYPSVKKYTTIHFRSNEYSGLTWFNSLTVYKTLFLFGKTEKGTGNDCEKKFGANPRGKDPVYIVHTEVLVQVAEQGKGISKTLALLDTKWTKSAQIFLYASGPLKLFSWRIVTIASSEMTTAGKRCRQATRAAGTDLS